MSLIFLNFITGILIRKIFGHKSWMLPLSLTQSLARLEIPEKKAYATFAWLLFFEPEMT